MKPVIIIPARMQSTRFPGKPLAKINGLPMIVHVINQARKSRIKDIVVAVCEAEVAEIVTQHGAVAVMTDPELPSGSDRIWQALQKVDPQGHFDTIINLQGDLPLVQPSMLEASLEALSSGADIATLAAIIDNEEEIHNPNVVKVVMSLPSPQHTIGRAFYFTRAVAPYGQGAYLHHVGLYTYTRSALSRFVKAPVTPLEVREKLEQLRALELGMQIAVSVIDEVPLGVDTPDDLREVEAILAKQDAVLMAEAG